jgi:hypothetical protein
MSVTPGTSNIVPERALVDEFAQQVLLDAAPEELAIFEETAEEFHRDPDGVLRAQGKDEAVGFGLDVALLTPYVLAVATSALSFLLSTVADAAKTEAKPVVAELVRRLFRRKAAPDDPDQAKAVPDPVTLSTDQAGQVREVAFARASDLGLSEDKARLLADAVVGGLRVTA